MTTITTGMRRAMIHKRQQGEGIVSIATDMKVSKSTVWHYTKEVPNPPHTSRKVDPHTLAGLLTLSNEMLAERFGCTKASMAVIKCRVRRRLRDAESTRA